MCVGVCFIGSVPIKCYPHSKHIHTKTGPKITHANTFIYLEVLQNTMLMAVCVCVFVHIHIDPVKDAIIAMCNFHLHRLHFWRTLSPL